MARRPIAVLVAQVSAVTVSALLLIAALCTPPPSPAAAQAKTKPKAAEFLFVQTAKNVAYRDGVLTLTSRL